MVHGTCKITHSEKEIIYLGFIFKIYFVEKQLYYYLMKWFSIKTLLCGKPVHNQCPVNIIKVSLKCTPLL